MAVLRQGQSGVGRNKFVLVLGLVNVSLDTLEVAFEDCSRVMPTAQQRRSKVREGRRCR